ncbi:Crp/Fnr family transcriptional regulator [Actinoplanes derwentensis]|uniref:cAMP-binding domain of CRP or a regulatory subunit of cAMP-dependent protein kinases n=1 Tax=Actinoplanes derwentensis TaxID=113562 RepID=A0A1H2C8K5_9ACTN|nr:Crp/Fnr family transcriptional regulator [Actinoplanes derwentensis]GID86519.1 Crp/Fnr family transcriptional regulator [Actinoplanes derwentensis]SDT66731.1 cAMP-binding domain of CRP or a regulatory subunit of cAMP-dependent protein kinases [Actinoplanes derwentensis]
MTPDPTTGWAPATFLGGLTPGTAGELLGLCDRRRHPAGGVILREGVTGSQVVLLVNGFVKVTTAVDGQATLLGIRMPGELIGEIGALTGAPRNATVTACGPVQVGVASRVAFEDFLRRHPDTSNLVMATIARKLTWANRRRSDFAAFPAHIRLARLLVEISEVCGRPAPDGRIEIAVPLSQPELAAMIAIARATVQKALHELRALGLISTAYRRIVIADPAGLHRLAGG